jgi:hypothetical protein
MKKLIFLCLTLFIASQTTFSQIDLNQIKNTATNIVSGGGTSSLSSDEIINGLKEALNVGTKNAAGSASKLDGYLKNPLIKIPFPPEAKDMESKLRTMGMGKQVDKFVETVNRGAEEAAKQAAPIFINAITSMTIEDGMNVLKGADNAATTFLKNKTYNDLKTKFLPVVKTALQKVEVTKYWNPLATSYNKIPMVKKVNPNLDDYTTTKALDGLFLLVEGEEKKIRKDPAAQVTDLLKKVFGSLGK